MPSKKIRLTISRIGSLATGYEIEYLLKKNQSSDDSSLSALL